MKITMPLESSSSSSLKSIKGLIQLSKRKCLMDFEMSEIILLCLQLQLQQDTSLLQLLCHIWQTCVGASDALKHLNWLKMPAGVQLN